MKKFLLPAKREALDEAQAERGRNSSNVVTKSRTVDEASLVIKIESDSSCDSSFEESTVPSQHREPDAAAKQRRKSAKRNVSSALTQPQAAPFPVFQCDIEDAQNSLLRWSVSAAAAGFSAIAFRFFAMFHW
jgi:hypothetical protein